MKEWSGRYEDEASVADQVAAGNHREIIGGMWDDLGQLQFDFLRSRGMDRDHYLLDLGCGSGRLAVKAAPFLRDGRYYGVDISPALIQAAREELKAVGCDYGYKLRRSALTVSADFEPPLDVGNFDYVMAQSLFTHLPLERWDQALQVLTKRLRKGSRLYATFFVAPYHTPELRHERGGITTYSDRDPFHFVEQQIVERATYRRWEANVIGDWGHPRDQQMFEFIAPGPQPY